MRQLDQQTIAEIGVPSVVLMENAGRTTYQILRQEFPDLDDPVVVLAGRHSSLKKQLAWGILKYLMMYI